MNWLESLTHEGPFEIHWPGERPWIARHHHEDPASPASIQRAVKEVGIPIPEELELFWRVSDGGILFKNEGGAAWGWRLPSTLAFLECQHKWRRRFFDDWRTGYLVFLELLEPSVALVLDTTKGGVYALQDDMGQMKSTRVGGTLGEAFGRLVDTQGGLWWAWGA